MKKETLITIIISTIGGLVFALGMCMVLLPELNMFKSGIIVGIVGLLILLSLIPITRKNKPKKEKKQINYGLVITIITGIIGSLIMGFGMSKVMVENPLKEDIIIGLITGIIGLLICILNYPIYSYIKGNK